MSLKRSLRTKALDMRRQGLGPDGEPLPPDAGLEIEVAPNGTGVTVHGQNFHTRKEYQKEYEARRRQNSDFKEKERLQQVKQGQMKRAMAYFRRNSDVSNAESPLVDALFSPTSRSPLVSPGSVSSVKSSVTGQSKGRVLNEQQKRKPQSIATHAKKRGEGTQPVVLGHPSSGSYVFTAFGPLHTRQSSSSVRQARSHELSQPESLPHV